jgi:hypothetical protein
VTYKDGESIDGNVQGGPMNLYEEIAKKAYELYRKSGCTEGRDFQNWLEAERLVLAGHASEDIGEVEEMTNNADDGQDILLAW